LKLRESDLVYLLLLLSLFSDSFDLESFLTADSVLFLLSVLLLAEFTLVTFCVFEDLPEDAFCPEGLLVTER